MVGVIQNFEFVFEISFKMIKRRIELDSASPNDVDELNFRDVLRVAGEKGLVDDVSAWFEYHSDLDLVIITDQPLPLSIQGALADAFSDSDLPWRVDVVDWATTSDSFKAIIERDGVVVCVPANGSAS